MTKIKYILQILLCAVLLSGCEIYDDTNVTVKRKAVAYFRYHYDNGSGQTLEDIQSMRLFIFDKDGILYRDTLFTRHTATAELGVMQTYISNGSYTFVSWVNVDNTTTSIGHYESSLLHLSNFGTDCIMHGKVSAPIIKGDSLIFDIALFKSVFRVNVTIEGLDLLDKSEDYYFGMNNRSSLNFDNRPTGTNTIYRPVLTPGIDGLYTGSFYTPWFSPGEELTVGVYNDDPAAEYPVLCRMSVRNFTNFVGEQVGKDVQINIHIRIQYGGVTITIRDWEDQVIQDEYFGA